MPPLSEPSAAFERGGPGMSSAERIDRGQDAQRRNRMDSVEQCRKLLLRRATSHDDPVPPQLTV
jgi:hypothetical protein